MQDIEDSVLCYWLSVTKHPGDSLGSDLLGVVESALIIFWVYIPQRRLMRDQPPLHIPDSIMC